MPAEDVRVVTGSFDDVPDVALRTVLAVPLTLPPLPAAALAPGPVTSPPPVPGRVARRSHHRRRAAPVAAGSPVMATVQVGLSAALTVLVAVALALGLIQVLVR